MFAACYSEINLPSCRKVSLTSMRFPRTVAHRRDGVFQGATMKKRYSPKAGDKYGRLTIQSVSKSIPPRRATVFATCECGKSGTYLAKNVCNGNTKSCGC